MNPDNLNIGDKVKHYKGGIYIIINKCMHTETLDELIVYQSLKDKKIWARPVSMFCDYIYEKGCWRFTKIK
jgi:hypothetical protein